MDYNEKELEMKYDETKNVTSWLDLSEDEVQKITDTSVCMYNGGPNPV